MKNRLQPLVLLFCLCLMTTACAPESSNSNTNTDPPVPEEPVAPVPPAPETAESLVIKDGRLGDISIGANIASLGDKLKAGVLSTGEGEFDVYFIMDPNGEELGYVVPSFFDESIIDMIVIADESISTEDGLAVGKTYGDILERYPWAEVHGSEIESRTSATVYKKDANGTIYNMNFRLDAYHTNYDLQGVTIAPETKILELSVHQPIKGDEEGLPPMSENLAKLQGHWQSVDDPMSSMTFQYSTKYEQYEGLGGISASLISIDDRCSEDEDPVAAPDSYLNEEDGICLYIVKLTEDVLELSYVGRGNTLSYKRVE